MRENKFSAFKNSSWWYSDDEAYNLKEYDGVLYLCEDVKFYINTEEYELEIIGVAYQYTGLKDKNGVEIYEGDLLKIEMDWGYGLAEIIIKVYFENGSFRAKALNSHEDTFLLELPYLEVIGNIYENPELLRED